MAQFQPIVAPSPAAPAMVNLLSSAIRPAVDPTGDWVGGVAWRSESCPSVQGFNPCAELDSTPAEDGNTLVYYMPVAYRVSDECTTLSGRYDNARLVRMADAVASHVVATELWTGALSKLDPYDLPMGGATGVSNAYLASDAAELVPAPGTVKGALAALEEATRAKTFGQRAFLHLPIHLLAEVAGDLDVAGGELRTKLGSVVVADSGYDGSGPDGTGTGWMYGTGPVAVMLGPLATVAEGRATVDMTTNRQRVWADRPFAVLFDPCALVGVDTGG